MAKGMQWEKADREDRLKQSRPDPELGAMTDKKRRFLRDRQAQLKREAEARRRRREG